MEISVQIDNSLILKEYLKLAKKSQKEIDRMILLAANEPTQKKSLKELLVLQNQLNIIRTNVIESLID